MAVRTLTCSVFDQQPKQVQEGVVSISGQYRGDATAYTTGDTIFLAKIPHGAKFVDCYFDHSTGATAFGLDYGYAKGGAAAGAASLSALVSAGAQAAILRKTTVGTIADISVSDTHIARYGILAATAVSGTTTTSLIINFIYTYRCDGAGG